MRLWHFLLTCPKVTCVYMCEGTRAAVGTDPWARAVICVGRTSGSPAERDTWGGSQWLQCRLWPVWSCHPAATTGVRDRNISPEGWSGGEFIIRYVQRCSVVVSMCVVVCICCAVGLCVQFFSEYSCPVHLQCLKLFKAWDRNTLLHFGLASFSCNCCPFYSYERDFFCYFLSPLIMF